MDEESLHEAAEENTGRLIGVRSDLCVLGHLRSHFSQQECQRTDRRIDVCGEGVQIN